MGTVFSIPQFMAAEAQTPAQALFAQHCEKCHSGTKPKGRFAVASLSDDFTDKKNREHWLAVLEQLKNGEMPPKEKPRPPEKELHSVMEWISTRSASAENARRETEGRVVMRRLNRAEYANTVRDLLGEVESGAALTAENVFQA
ncbi:MAG: c-type cytochrome, partial [Prosthecobacter sp.]|nr:c-type cytochrome [Prosthecobacter sp.]